MWFCLVKADVWMPFCGFADILNVHFHCGHNRIENNRIVFKDGKTSQQSNISVHDTIDRQWKDGRDEMTMWKDGMKMYINYAMTLWSYNSYLR